MLATGGYPNAREKFNRYRKRYWGAVARHTRIGDADAPAVAGQPGLREAPQTLLHIADCVDNLQDRFIS